MLDYIDNKSIHLQLLDFADVRHITGPKPEDTIEENRSVFLGLEIVDHFAGELLQHVPTVHLLLVAELRFQKCIVICAVCCITHIRRTTRMCIRLCTWISKTMLRPNVLMTVPGSLSSDRPRNSLWSLIEHRSKYVRSFAIFRLVQPVRGQLQSGRRGLTKQKQIVLVLWMKCKYVERAQRTCVLCQLGLFILFIPSCWRMSNNVNRATTLCYVSIVNW